MSNSARTKSSALGVPPPNLIHRPDRLLSMSNRLYFVSILCTLLVYLPAVFSEASQGYTISILILLMVFGGSIVLNLLSMPVAGIYVAAFGVTLQIAYSIIHSAGFFSQSICFAAVAVVSFIVLDQHNRARWLIVVSTGVIYIVAQTYRYLYPGVYQYPDVPYDELVVYVFCMVFIMWGMTKYRTEKEELIDELKIKNEELEVLSHDLQNFAYVASHDLKAPLRTMHSFVGLLENNMRKGNYKEMQENISYVKSGVTQMSHVIEDILAMSKVNAKADPAPERVNLNDVLDKALLGLSDEIAAHGATVTSEYLLPEIAGNESEFLQVFQNIIQNGIKYNESDQPEVVVTSRIENTEFVLSFRDNGIGIAKEYHEQVFQFFTRLHDQEKYQGTGLGLALCQKVAKKYHGEIRIYSEPGSGSTFELILPASILSEK